jgi:glucosamine--fructose-6-phosphate aminotransferase (isomerizing)
MNYGNSFELALKLMETCYVVAERFSSADFLHGPLAVVERRFPVIVFAPSGVTKAGSIELIGKLKELQADCLVITDDDEVADISPISLKLPESIDEFLSPIPLIVPAQMFAAMSLSKVTKTL